MCGRYRFKSSEIAEAVSKGLLPRFEEFSELKIKHNVEQTEFGPLNSVPVIRLLNDRQTIVSMTWGFVPSWGNPKEASINARGETVAKMGKFRDAFKSSRCLIPTDGFFEPKGPKGMKNRPQFYFHRSDNAPFAMAGIFSETAGGLTCAVITIGPNQIVAPIHDRMPVIVNPTNYTKWLDPATSLQELQKLITPAPDADLVVEPAYPGKRHKNDDPGLFD
jgi:putative SOS response-associated peptidase YedK